MNRRAFLTTLTTTIGTLALVACQRTAPTATSAPPTATIAASISSPPPSAAPSVTTSPPATPTMPATPTLSTTAQPASPTVPLATPATASMPLFDTHVHYSEDAWGPIPIPQALDLMDLAGTQIAMVSSTPDEGTIRLHQAARDRIIPILRPYRTRDDMSTWFDDPTIIPYLEERLKLGVHRGIGEFHLYGENANTAVIGQMIDLARRDKLLLHAHSDQRAVEILCQRAPDLRVLWAHAGYAEPATLRQMVERYPQLLVETAIRSDIGSGGQLGTAWRDLFLAYPDRFMIGTDSYIVSRWVSMPIILGDVRAWLLTLPTPIAQQLAWRNAARLMGIGDGPFRGD